MFTEIVRFQGRIVASDLGSPGMRTGSVRILPWFAFSSKLLNLSSRIKSIHGIKSLLAEKFTAAVTSHAPTMSAFIGNVHNEV